MNRDAKIWRENKPSPAQIADRPALRQFFIKYFGFDLPEVEDIRVPERFCGMDLSVEMVAKVRKRLDRAQNAAVAAEDGQTLSLAGESFDAVLCSLGLGLFLPDPARALAEFHRVLRPGGRAAVSVSDCPGSFYNGLIERHSGAARGSLWRRPPPGPSRSETPSA